MKSEARLDKKGKFLETTKLDIEKYSSKAPQYYSENVPDLLKKMVNRSFRELDHPELNLNLALMSDGFCLKLSKGTKIDKPIHFVHHSCPRKNYSASHLHNLVFAEEDSCATIVESYSGDLRKNYFSNLHSIYGIDSTATYNMKDKHFSGIELREQFYYKRIPYKYRI